MPETNFFPKPNDLVQDTAFQHVINVLRNNILNHNFKFKPEYQYKKYFTGCREFLMDHNWNLTLDGELWNITPMV